MIIYFFMIRVILRNAQIFLTFYVTYILFLLRGYHTHYNKGLLEMC